MNGGFKLGVVVIVMFAMLVPSGIFYQEGSSQGFGITPVLDTDLVVNISTVCCSIIDGGRALVHGVGIENSGPDDADEIQVFVELQDLQATFHPEFPSSDQCELYASSPGGTAVLCTVGSIPAGGFESLTVAFDLPLVEDDVSVTTIAHLAIQGESFIDEDVGNNSDSIATQILGTTIPRLDDSPFYPPYDEIVDYLNDLDGLPIVETFNIGNTSESPPRDILAIKISDAPQVQEDEPRFVFVGIIHGREPLGFRIVYELTQDLLEDYGTDPDITSWVNGYEIWIIPVLNPYGYDERSRFNAHLLDFVGGIPFFVGSLSHNHGGDFDANFGVDLNRNFDFRWDRCEETYGEFCDHKGSEPFSEPETRALRDLVLEQRPLAGITFHSGIGGVNGSINRPWAIVPGGGNATSDVGNDLTNGTADDLVLHSPRDGAKMDEIAQIFADSVNASRSSLVCPLMALSGVACGAPDIIRVGPIGYSSHYLYAATGMLDLTVETNNATFNAGFFYTATEDDDDLDCFDEGAGENCVQLANAYRDDYNDGLKGLMGHFLFERDHSGFSYTGPGITGHVSDCMGNPLAATVKVLERNGIRGIDDVNTDGVGDQMDLHVDFDNLNMDYDIDGDENPFTETDLDDGDGTDINFRTAEDEHGRYFRLLRGNPDNYQVEYSMPGFVTNTTDITVNDTQLEVVDVALDADQDLDGLTDCAEIRIHGTNPLDPDTDDDGLMDGDEINTFGTDPLDADTDDDFACDGCEVNFIFSDPLDPDTDDDGLLDGDEADTFHTNPNDPDTDDDGLNDGLEEISLGSDALDSDTDDDGLFDGVDLDVLLFSDNFSDVGLGGATTGTIMTRGSQVVVVSDALNPSEGLRIVSQGGPTLAQLSFCDGAVIATLSSGDVIIKTGCSPDPIQIIQGPVELQLFGSDGSTATVTLETGFTLTFDPETFAFGAPSDNPGPITILLGDGNQITLIAGETLERLGVNIVINPGVKPVSTINLKKERTVTVVLLGSSDLNVNDFDNATLRFGPSHTVPIRTSFSDVNSDGQTDLVSKYKLSSVGITQTGQIEVCLTGKLLNDTPFQGCGSANLIRK